MADTGAGPVQAPFELLLDEEDCLHFSYRAGHLVRLGGAYEGEFRAYAVSIEIPELGFSSPTIAVGVAGCPPGFQGIACFRFLNRFAYGNFGQASQFGLAVLL